MDSRALWERFKVCQCECPGVGLTLDYSRMNFGPDFFEKMRAASDRAFAAMRALEGGAIVNPDERRMAGHYWLRAPELAPEASIRIEILGTLKLIKHFAKLVHAGKAKPPKARRFSNVLVIGIGLAQALGDG